VEFGVISITFTLLMFAIVDFGLTLNSWVRLSSATREVARAASVGAEEDELKAMIEALALPGVTRNSVHFPGGYCCDPGDSLELNITFYNNCIPGAPSGCNEVTASQLDDQIWHEGTCPSSPACQHPAPGDTIVVSIAAAGMQIVTPLVRPFFRTCRDNPDQPCFVRIGSTTTMRYEGR